MLSIVKQNLYGPALVMTLTVAVIGTSPTALAQDDDGDVVNPVNEVNETVQAELLAQGQKQLDEANFVEAVATFARAATLFPGNTEIYDALQLAKLKAKEQGGTRSLERIDETIAKLDALDASRIQDLEAAMEAEEQARKQAEEYVAKLNAELEHYSDRNSDLMANVEDMEKRIGELATERDSLAKQTTELAVSADEKAALAASMRTEIESLKTALTEAETQASEARTELEEMEEQRQKALAAATKAGASEKEVLPVADTAREKELEDELERMRRVRQRLEAETKFDSTESAQAEFRLKNLLQEHTEAVDEIQRLKSKIQDLEESVEATER
jgi:chromosome segregation ATPase